MRTTRAFLCLSVALTSSLLFACRASDDASSPEAVAKRVVRAMDRAEAAAYTQTLPPLDALIATFDCGRSDTLRGRLLREREEVYLEFEARRQAGHRLRLRNFNGEGSKTSRLGPGDIFEGCQVLKDVDVHEAHVSIELTRNNRLDPSTEIWTFLRFEEAGPWHFLRN